MPDDFRKLSLCEIRKLDEEYRPMLQALAMRGNIENSVKTYIDRGWGVIPLHTVVRGVCSCGQPCKSPGKHPTISGGVNAVIHDVPTAIKWWTDDPDANIGICTGTTSGLVVLDVDPKNSGDKTLEAFEAKYGKLPETPTVRTGSGGAHYYFRHPGGKVRNSASRVGPGLDIRGDGGYVVAPPSLHTSGNRYEWTVGPDTPLAELPKWLMDLIQTAKPSGRAPTGIGRIADGQRNTTLASVAGSMRRVGLNPEVICDALIAVNSGQCDPPLSDEEVNKIANSIGRYDPVSADDGSKLILTPLDTITPEKLQWLWPDRIPLGKITLLVGSPGLGKTFLTLDIAARVSTGRAWPDMPGQAAMKGSVIVLSAEDDMADTVVPRVMAASGDRTRIFTLAACKGDGGYSLFTLSEDIAKLARLLDENPDVRLLIIDPISAYLGRVDSHNDAEVRRVLSPLAKIAADHKVAVVCVTHHNKAQNTTAAGKIMGSVAFNAAARQVWHVTEDPDDADRRLLVIGKHNLTKAKTGLAFRLVETIGPDNPFGAARIEFDPEPILATAEDIMAEERQKDRSANKTEEAAAFLLRELAQGPRELHEIAAKAESQGISTATLRRAKESLGVDFHYEGKGPDRKTLWYMPEQNAA